ncbi:hypothetical protein [Nodosilinea sp. P-1105]|nr:hypothetical protein [Nodosilinea sp. P-1105]
MTETNGNAPFTHNDKKSGDVIRSEDWNAAMNEVMGSASTFSERKMKIEG